jgi:hypothetical protein
MDRTEVKHHQELWHAESVLVECCTVFKREDCKSATGTLHDVVPSSRPPFHSTRPQHLSHFCWIPNNSITTRRRMEGSAAPPKPAIVNWYTPCTNASESKQIQRRKNMKRITLLGCAAALFTTVAFSQTPPTLPSNPTPPPQTPVPSQPGDRNFLPPGQQDKDTLPPGKPYTDDQPPGRPFQDKTVPGRPFQNGSSTNAGAGSTNNAGGIGSGSQTNSGGITNNGVSPAPRTLPREQ